MKQWNILLVALLILASCSDEVNVFPNIPDVGATEAEVIIRMQVPGHKKPIAYAATAADENKITELDILAFAKQNAAVDTLAYRIKVSSDQISDVTGAENGNKKDIHVKLQRSESNLKLVLIANGSSVVDAASVKGGESLTDIFEKLNYEYNGKWNTSTMTPIPMWGQTSGYISVKNPIVSEPLNITLLRSVAKIDLGVDVYNDDPSIGFGKRFKLQHVYVYNAMNKACIVPDIHDAGLVENKVTAPKIPDDATPIKSAQEYTLTGSDLFNEIYLPESDCTKEDEHTFLVIGGVYDGGQETFYRIDFVNKEDKKLDLLRNYRFLVNITNVARDGFGTKEEAAAAKSSHINYSLSVLDENINSIIYNGQYVLGVSESAISLDWDAVSNNSIAVATDYPEGWKASTDARWIDLKTASGGAQSSLSFDVKRNDEAKLKRTGRIILEAGSLVQEILVSQYAGANSYILSPNGEVRIPVLMANTDGTTRISSGASLQTELLWQDGTNVIRNITVTGTGESAVINVTAGSNEGNALITVKNGGNTVWSWHVWVTSYNPNNNASQKSYNGTVFMDRNIGALSTSPNTPQALGLLYQWGRKDPFPSSSSTTTNERKIIVDINGSPVLISSEKVSLGNNLENAIKNPMTFYTSDEFPWYSWYGLSEANNSLWRDTNGDKTAYDPCPQGWRVPLNTNVWNGLTPSSWNNGAVLPSIGYFPANGDIDFANGILNETGEYGYYWTAEPSGARASAFMIREANVSINSSPLRASGNSIRCVKE